MVSRRLAKVVCQDQLYNDHQPYFKFDTSGQRPILATSEIRVFTAVRGSMPLDD